VASLSAVLDEACNCRRQNMLLRADLSRLRSEHARARQVHADRRRSCEQMMLHATLKRSALPSWPVWSGPTGDVRLTLVSLE